MRTPVLTLVQIANRDADYDDKANYEYLPLVGDGKGGFFPLQLVAISTRQAFPRANVLTPALKAKILSLRLTSQNSSATHEMLEALGKEFIDKALAPRTFAEDVSCCAVQDIVY